MKPAGTLAVTNRTKSMAEPLLALTGVTKRFGALVALADASLDIMPGEVHCILGENGAGKSTLCNLIFGVHVPDAGAMRFRGETYRPSGPSDALSNGIAMVHQHFSLVHDMTVVDNVDSRSAARLRAYQSLGAAARETGERLRLRARPLRQDR